MSLSKFSNWRHQISAIQKRRKEPNRTEQKRRESLCIFFEQKKKKHEIDHLDLVREFQRLEDSEDPTAIKRFLFATAHSVSQMQRQCQKIYQTLEKDSSKRKVDDVEDLEVPANKKRKKSALPNDLSSKPESKTAVGADELNLKTHPKSNSQVISLSSSSFCLLTNFGDSILGSSKMNEGLYLNQSNQWISKGFFWVSLPFVKGKLLSNQSIRKSPINFFYAHLFHLFSHSPTKEYEFALRKNPL